MNKKQAAQTVQVLHQALPYLERFGGRHIVIKLGGSLLSEPELLGSFARDISLMRLIGMYPVLIHGGGPYISALLKERRIETRFEDGVRVTDQKTVAVVEEALSTINQNIRSHVENAGATVAAFARAKHSPVKANPISDECDNRLGEVKEIDVQRITKEVARGAIPVLSPIGRDARDLPLNINADTVASKVASALNASKFILLTDVPGILSAERRTISELSPAQLIALIESRVISDGMLPKVQCALEAVENGISHVHIIDGRTEHSVLLEIFTDQGVGTLITA